MRLIHAEGSGGDSQRGSGSECSFLDKFSGRTRSASLGGVLGISPGVLRDGPPGGFPRGILLG